MQRKNNSGFTLIELAIVLTILGLLVGGIMAGRSLIRSSELRNVISESESFVTAVRSFKDQYRAFPGDMAEATRIWGRADNGSFSGQCGSPAANQGTGTQTCNGDGNGYINQGFENNNETFRFWQHLANAGLIQGKFTGVAGSAGYYHHVPGVNAPTSKATGAAWSPNNEPLDHLLEAYDRFFTRQDEEYNGMFVGGADSEFEPFNPTFTVDEVWSIDKKIDDGKPGTGRVHTMWWADCSTSVNGLDFDTAVYKLQNSGKKCAIIFYRAFG